MAKDDKHKHREPARLWLPNWHQGPLAMEDEIDFLGRMYLKYPNGKPDKDGYNPITANPILIIRNEEQNT